MCTHINNFASISRIPDEILAQIFLAYAEDCRDKYENARPLSDDCEQGPYCWLIVASVCSRWRNVSLACSRLWEWIVPLRHEAISVFVERSACRPLSIVHRRIPWDRPGISVAIVYSNSLHVALRELPRIRRLDIDADSFPPKLNFTSAPLSLSRPLIQD